MKARRARTAAAVSAVMAALALAACSGTSAGNGGDRGDSGTVAATTPTPPASTRSLPSPTVTVSPTTRTTKPAAPLDRPADFGTGVVVRVDSTKAIDVTGKGPGELSGPAVAFTLKLTNGTDKAIDLTNSVVAAYYGDDVPANESSSSPSRHLRGSVAAHRSTTGTYVFLIPPKQRAKVHLSISYDPTKPVVSLVGDLR